MSDTSPKILVFAGSVRAGSFNARLAALAAREIAAVGGAVTLISLRDYPLPLYDGDLEATDGVPAQALALKQLFCAHAGLFIAGPEYNASITPLLKNTLDWISRVREPGEPPLAAFKGRVFAIGSASPGAYGGFRSQMALRQVLELGVGALVLPDGVAVPEAHKAFAEDGTLTNPRSAAALTALSARLVAAARAPL